MKLVQKCALGVSAAIFLLGLWMSSWLGPEHEDDPEDDWPAPPE